MKLKKRYLTLIEVLIVIIIIGIFAGAVGINVNNAIKNQRFKTEVELVTDTLRLAQDLMLILDIDVKVMVKSLENGKGIDIWLDVDNNYLPRWQGILKRAHRKLREIHHFNFVERGPFPESQPGQLEIRFFSAGTMMSKGIIYLGSREDITAPGTIIRAIPLFGYPHAIASVYEDAELKHSKIEKSWEQGLEFRLTQNMKKEIMNDQAAKTR